MFFRARPWKNIDVHLSWITFALTLVVIQSSKAIAFSYLCNRKNETMIRIQNFINGELLAPVKGQYIDNYEPATGKVYGEIPNSSLAERVSSQERKQVRASHHKKGGPPQKNTKN